MSASPLLPPNGRDFQVYQRVVVESASTRIVADEFRISQTRVRQIVERVTQWLTATLPKTPEIDESALLCVGRHVAADRLELIYRDAMDDWRKSKQPKFAGLAIRVIMAQTKVPAFPGTIEALAADAIEGPLPDDEVGQTFVSAKQTVGRPLAPDTDLVTRVPPGNALPRGPSLPAAMSQERRDRRFPDRTVSNTADKNVCPPVPPPLRDCSLLSPQDARPVAEPAADFAATSASAEPSHNLPPSASAARKEFFAPAHPAAEVGDEPVVTELKITPSQLGFSTAKHLTRRERRRLKRKLSA
jgi:hypothetical protein